MIVTTTTTAAAVAVAAAILWRHRGVFDELNELSLGLLPSRQEDGLTNATGR